MKPFLEMLLLLLLASQLWKPTVGGLGGAIPTTYVLVVLQYLYYQTPPAPRRALATRKIWNRVRRGGGGRFEWRHNKEEEEEEEAEVDQGEREKSLASVSLQTKRYTRTSFKEALQDIMYY